MLPQIDDLEEHQKLEETKKDSPLETWEGMLPQQHLEFRLVASKLVKE